MVYLMEEWANWDAIHRRNVCVYNDAVEAQAEADQRNEHNKTKRYPTSFFYVGDGTNDGVQSLGPVTRTSYGR